MVSFWPMKAITFYTKPGCHLCEDGEWILEMTLRGGEMPVTTVDISADIDLAERYGRRIPVLSHPDLNTELDWPFTPDTILAWLKG